MAKSIWEQILDNRKGVIEALARVKTVRVQNFSRPDLAKIPTPIAFIWSGARERQHELTGGFEQWLRELSIEVWGKGMDMDALEGDIHQAMYADRTCGTLAIDLVATGVPTVDVVDPARAIGGLVMTFEITYRHSEGNPYSQA